MQSAKKTQLTHQSGLLLAGQPPNSSDNAKALFTYMCGPTASVAPICIHDTSQSPYYAPVVKLDEADQKNYVTHAWERT